MAASVIFTNGKHMAKRVIEKFAAIETASNSKVAINGFLFPVAPAIAAEAMLFARNKL